jgi:DMSO/TMAO reductase YedYZ molybdopterin-dependent catalytic subunit
MTTDATSRSSAAEPAADEPRFLGVPAPPGPTRRAFWRSPLRGPWLTAFLGSLLLALLTVVALTGFLSHEAYEPSLGDNAIVPADRDLELPISWPAGVDWLYALNQGLHVTAGVVAVPLLLAKLWSVIPRLFAWPPVASPAQGLERLALLLLVGGALFLFATGLVNIQSWYPFGFNFVVAHYYAAIIFTGALLLHVAVKTPRIRRAYREQGVLKPLRASLAETRPEPLDPDGLVTTNPAPPSLSRRGLLGLVGLASAALAVVTAGQSIGGPLRRTAIFAPRGAGERDWPVNKTAAAAGITQADIAGWRLTLAGPGGERTLVLDEVRALPQTAERLTIGCVEGWSTTQDFEGVALRELGALVGAPAPRRVTAVSLQEAILGRATFNRAQSRDPRSMLALRAAGADLTPDHGAPARIMVPGAPGVHQTKWVTRLEFQA